MDIEYAQYLLKKTKEDYNLIAEKFSMAREKIWEEMRFLFDNYLVPGEHILDLGCGNGRFYEAVKDKKVDYIGIDNSQKLIEIAKKRYPEAKFQVADALNLPFPNNYFDKVYSIAVLQHIPSEEFRLQFLREAKRVLKPSGLLILTVWNLWRKSYIITLIKNSLLKVLGKSRLDFKDFLMPAKKHTFFRKFYYHCFTKNELENLIKKAGFKLRKSGIISIYHGKKPRSNFYVITEN